MKHVRLIPIAMVACGAAVILTDNPFDAGTWPLPAPQLSIRVPFKLRLPGEYFIEISMPRANADKVHVVDETLPCNLSYTIEKNGVAGQPHEITSVSSSGEYGWANVVLYAAASPFPLSRGDYVISIYGGTGCAAATARGATVTIAESVQHPTERYLLSSLRRSLALLAVFGGLTVLAVIEVRSSYKVASRDRSSGA